MSEQQEGPRAGGFGMPGAAPPPIPSVASHLDLTGGPSGPRSPVRRYAADATSPLVHLAVAAVASVVALLSIRWFVESTSTADGGPSSYQWLLATSVAFGGDGPANYEVGRAGSAGWWVLVAMGIAAGALVVWLARLGNNARYGHGSFGAGLVIAAVPSWWVLPAVFDNNDVGFDLTEWKLRTFLLAATLVLQALAARWLFVHRLWKAGALPRPEVSFLLWVPHLVSGFLVWGALAYGYLTYEEGTRFDPSWQPTETSVQVAMWTGRATAIAVLVVAVIVTIRQHQGIAADHAAHQADLEERRLAVVPPLGAVGPTVPGAIVPPQ